MPLYLVHFSEPFHHARHYLGFVKGLDGLDSRLRYHRNGSGSRLLRAVTRAGIDFTLVRVWEVGSRADERRLKQHGSVRYCPTCNPARWFTNGNVIVPSTCVCEET